MAPADPVQKEAPVPIQLMEAEADAKPTENTKEATSSGPQEASETPEPQADQPLTKGESADTPAVKQAEVPCHDNSLQEVEPESPPVGSNLPDQSKRRTDTAAG